MDISSATAVSPAATGADDATKSTGSGALINSDFETFLRMLTTQMQNQDPLEPLKSDQLSVQLATFSGVEQQVRTNDLLTQLGQQLGTGTLSQFTGWVGMEARTVAPGLYDGTPITIAPQPDALADAAALVVRDSAGIEVARFNIPPLAAPFDWDGTAGNGTQAPPGHYDFEVESYANGAVIARTPAEVYARITEVRMDASGAVLILEGGAMSAPDAVTALRGG